MCDPISMGLTLGALGGASSIMGFIGQNQAASANRKAANLSYANTENQLGERSAQIDAQQSENTVQAAIGRIQAQGRISASASSMGASGDVATRAANAADFTAGRGLSIEDVNSANQRIGVGFEQDNAFYARQSQINSVLPESPIQLALGLAKAGAAGVAGYGQFGGTFGGGGAGGSGPPGIGSNPGADAALSSQLSAIG